MTESLEQLMARRKAEDDRERAALERYKGLYVRWREYNAELRKMNERTRRFAVEVEQAYQEMAIARKEFQDVIEKETKE